MGRYCSVVGCKSNDSTNFSFHKYVINCVDGNWKLIANLRKGVDPTDPTPLFFHWRDRIRINHQLRSKLGLGGGGNKHYFLQLFFLIRIFFQTRQILLNFVQVCRSYIPFYQIDMLGPVYCMYSSSYTFLQYTYIMYSLKQNG